MRKNNTVLRLMMAPGLFFMLVIIFLPLISTLFLSFFHWRGIGFSLKFAGLYNYIKIFNDVRLINALKNNLVWLVMFLILPVVGGFILALALNEKIRFRNFFRSIFYFPSVLSFIALGVIFSFIYSTDYGLLNQTLRSINLGHLTVKWLASDIVIPAITIAASWAYVGFVMVLVLAALQQVDKNLIEAAEIDGANSSQRLFHVTIPSIMPVITVILAITFINSMRVFGLVWIMTHGGPVYKSEVIGILMYKKAFESSLWGQGSAYGVLLFMITIIPILIYTRSMVKKEV